MRVLKYIPWYMTAVGLSGMVIEYENIPISVAPWGACFCIGLLLMNMRSKT